MSKIARLPVNNMASSKSVVTTEKSVWDRLPDNKRRVASERGILIKAVMRIMQDGHSQRSAIELFLLRVDTQEVDQHVIDIACQHGRKKNPPTYSTMKRWVDAYNSEGLVGLAPSHKGSARLQQGWEARALHFYQLPSKPSICAVARKLISEGFTEIKEHQVRRYINNLPANMGDKSSKRLGPRLYANTQKKFRRRTVENIPPGSIYVGDGHTIDVYLQHPTGKGPWRAELTAWMDVSSRYLTGWYISEAESAHSTLFALSHAMFTHDHIPAVLHIDNGSGYKNKLMNDASTGFYNRFGMEVIHSLPYNAKAKPIERFFKTLKEDHNKWFPSYCGHDMADEAIQDLLKKHKKGEAKLPTLQQWMDSFENWLELYHNKSHRGLGGKTPAEVWAQLDPHRIEPKSAAIFWPRTTRTVQRQAIRLDNREYMHAELIAYNNRQVIVEYNLHNDTYVRVMDGDGRWICDATLVNKVDYVPASRLEEAKQKRLAQSIKRLEAHAQEKRERAGLAITHEQNLDELEALNAGLLLEEKTGPAMGADPVTDVSIDILDTNY